MNKQRTPAFVRLIALICLGVFFDAPVIQRQVEIPCYVGPNFPGQKPAFYLNETEWLSPSYALFWDWSPNPTSEHVSDFLLEESIRALALGPNLQNMGR